MPRRLRKLLFWLHLVLGLASGVVIFSLCITGVLLTYELQISDWADRQLVSDAEDAEPLSLQKITGLIVESEGRLPASVSLGDDPGDPVEASFGRRLLGTGLRERRDGLAHDHLPDPCPR